MNLTEREMYLSSAIEELRTVFSTHDNDQLISNQYYLEYKSLREKFPEIQVWRLVDGGDLV